MSIKDEVISLLSRVPVPPEDSLPAGVSAAVLREAENRHGITFPPKLREWLSTSNGPCVGPGGLFGIATIRENLDMSAIFEYYPMWKEKGWVPVAGDGCGNYYVVATRNEFGNGEPVLFVDVHETPYEPTFIVASDIWKFLKFILSKEIHESRWPFNEAEVVACDPNITSFDKISFPWNA